MKIPKGNNDLASSSIFEQRKIYENLAGLDEMIDLWDERYRLYGRVDYGGYSTVPRPGKLALTSRDKNVYTLDFVQQSFSQLQIYISQQITTRVIDPEEGFLNDITAKKGWSNIDEIYEKQIEAIYSVFTDVYLRNDKKYLQFTTFSSFMELLVDFFSKSLVELPITQNSLVRSKFANFDVSGLTIHIAQENAGNDKKKYEDFINDVNFSWWKSICKKFGFLIDKNVPWRLVFDITSPYADFAYKNVGTNYQTVFSTHFERSFMKDFQAFQRNILRMYNNYVNFNPMVKIPHYCTRSGKTKTKDYRRTRRTKEQISASFPEFLWFRLYFWCKVHEQQIDISQSTFNHLLGEVGFLWKRNQKEEAFAFMDRRLSSLTNTEKSVSILF